MNIYVSGINYRSTPIEIREGLSFDTDGQRLALDSISRLPLVSECVLVSTCNRTEVYIYSESGNFDVSTVERVLCGIKGLDPYAYKKYFYTYCGAKAVKHLFNVACGLDSMVLGEDQILGQVKSAYDLSLEAGASSNVLNVLFRDAVTAAKKIKTNTELSKKSVSIGSLAVKLLVEVFEGKLEDKCALVIGAGKMGAIALKNLCSRGVGKIYVTNRSHGKAEDLSKIYKSVLPIEYGDRYSVIDACDMIISSTASPHYTITRDMLEKSAGTEKERVFVDLAVPMDIDRSVTELPGVRYFNIDGLKAVMQENLEVKTSEAAKAGEIIKEFVEEYEKWYEFRSALPVVKEVQNFTEDVVNERIAGTLARLKSASEEDRELITAAMKNTVNEIMDKLVYSIRKHGSKDDIRAYFKCLGDVMKEN